MSSICQSILNLKELWKKLSKKNWSAIKNKNYFLHKNDKITQPEQ